MRKGMVYLLLVLVAGWMALGTRIQETTRAEDKKPEPKPQPKKVKELMQRKLEHAQKILGAVTMNDLEKTARYAEELVRVRKEAGFQVLKTEMYELWSRSFDESAQKLIKAAKDKNLEAAKLGYLEMTLTCFHCHTYVRDMAKISLELP